MQTLSSPSLKRRSIADVFAATRAAGQIALMPFVPAGYPDVATTTAVLPALERGGASLIEVGFPFSDPIADGPTIAEAFTEALGKGIKVRHVFDAVRAARPSVSIPLVAMVSFSIVFRYGLERFCLEAKEAGFDGLILPDLPPPEAQRFCNVVRAAGLETILLVSPTTSLLRRREIARLSSGFIYYLSVSGITGERDKLPADLETNILAIQSLGGPPVCVGFGISKPAHVAQLRGVADGAIVGSAVVRQMREHLAGGPEAMAAAAENYCRSLLQP